MSAHVCVCMCRGQGPMLDVFPNFSTLPLETGSLTELGLTGLARLAGSLAPGILSSPATSQHWDYRCASLHLSFLDECRGSNSCPYPGAPSAS